VSAIAPYAAVFLSSFCVMVVELVAGRLIARNLGSSIYTWTSVIGVILAGLAAGNYLGGRIADRRSPARVLAFLFFLASLVSLTIPIVNRVIGDWVQLWTLSWPLRVSVHVGAVFFLPSMILGAISPVGGKMALDQGHLPGRTLGSVYAWGVIGSLLGTFLTGYWFIPTFGTAKVVWSVAAVLAGASLLIASGSVLRWSWAGLVLLAGIVQLGPWPWAEKAGAALQLREIPVPDLVHEVESEYCDIRVLASRDGDSEKLHLLLDKMMHNTYDPKKPDAFEDRYLRIFQILSHVVRPESSALQTLTIGGGAYLFPRYVERHWPGSAIDVVEIDPALTRIAEDVFGLPATSSIVTHSVDGRVFVNRLAEERALGRATPHYDLIYLDAFNDYSVPYQLTTMELNREIAALLKPDGAYLINAIDSFRQGLFLSAMVNTLEKTFEVVNVFYEGTGASLRGNARETFILCASQQELDWARVVRVHPEESGLHALTEDELAQIRRRTNGAVLTDDLAPTENLLAPVVKESAPGLAAGAIVSRGVAALNRKDFEEAEEDFRRALRMDPHNPRAHRYLGFLASQRGDLEAARRHYAESLRLNPAQRDVAIELVVALEAKGFIDEAAQHLERATTAMPHDRELRSNLAILHARRGDTARAIREFAALAQEDPRDFAARRNLGFALMQAGDLERACAELREADRLHPGDEAIQQGLRRCGGASP
jgi:Flp pilus assembly protein TadD/spermidine synthase